MAGTITTPPPTPTTEPNNPATNPTGGAILRAFASTAGATEWMAEGLLATERTVVAVVEKIDFPAFCATSFTALLEMRANMGVCICVCVLQSINRDSSRFVSKGSSLRNPAEREVGGIFLFREGAR